VVAYTKPNAASARRSRSRPDNPQAAIDLGALLASIGKTEAAVDQTQRAAVLDLLASCKNQKPSRSASTPRARAISESQ